MSEMKPCPFCGSQAALVKSLGPHDHSAKCPACFAFGPDAQTKALAVERWNDCAARSATPNKTLRDEFAMAALTGLEASIGTEFEMRPDTAAQYAYARADAMMKEREKVDD